MARISPNLGISPVPLKFFASGERRSIIFCFCGGYGSGLARYDKHDLVSAALFYGQSVNGAGHYQVAMTWLIVFLDKARRATDGRPTRHR